MSDAPLYDCIEADGTQFVLGVAHDHEKILRTTRTDVNGAGYFGDLNIAQLIVSPGLGDRAGLLGALALAQGMSR